MDSDDYTAHWESTLMGLNFWREQHRKSSHQPNDLSSPVLTGNQTQTADQPSTLKSGQSSITISTETKRSRRFSMTDVLNRTTFTTNSVRNTKLPGPSHSSTRLFDFGRRPRSQSRSRNYADRPRGSSLLRTPFGISSSRRKRGDSVDSILSMPPPQGLGSPDRPFAYFRGGVSWKYLSTDTETLGLDLFWPIKKEEENRNNRENDMLAIEELRPLCTFHNLRVLKITGMMQSYQKYIWQTAWLNPDLEELELEMALEPCVRKNIVGGWPLIKGGWRQRDIHHEEPVYYGNNGTGILNRRFGIGEYLDKCSIEQAKLHAMTQGPILSHLTVRRLTLTGFVVDADPFLLWFDPARLQRINFRDHCVDAGFYLPASMKGKVTVVYPRLTQENAVVIPGRRVELKDELKIIELRGGKKVSEKPYRMKQNPKWKGRDSKKKKNVNHPRSDGRLLTENMNRDRFEDKHAHGLREGDSNHMKSSQQ